MTRRPTIDWEAAFAFYAGQGPPRTYVSVANKFGISDTAVRNWASRNDWEERVARIDAENRQRLDGALVRDRDAKLAETFKLIDLVRDELIEQLTTKRGDVRLGDFAPLAKLEALLLGEPTERIHINEVKTVIAHVFQIAGRYVPAERRAEFLSEIHDYEATIDGEARELPEAGS